MTAAEAGKVQPSDIHLLRKEIEAQGELLAQERLDRRAETDRLRLQLETLKQLLEELNPGFIERYRSVYRDQREMFNPEAPGAELEK